MKELHLSSDSFADGQQSKINLLAQSNMHLHVKNCIRWVWEEQNEQFYFAYATLISHVSE